MTNFRLPKGGVRANQSAKARSSGYLVEGTLYSAVDIAARLGVSHRTVSDRIRRLRTQPGPVTWAALGEKP